MVKFIGAHLLEIILCLTIIILLFAWSLTWYQKLIFMTNYKRMVNNNKRLETERLKYRLQPHALNNTIAHIKAMANKMSGSIDALSEVLEYIIYEGEDSWVDINDELEFVRSFVRLNNLFMPFDDSIQVFENINITGDTKLPVKIPHLVTSYFIENAIKHGDKTSPEFLKIYIAYKDDCFELQVQNKHKEKIKKNNTSGGLGLKNMKRRLEILMPDKFEIRQSCDEKEYQSKLILNLKNEEIESGHLRGQ